jgi:hypothetical protein
MPSAIWTLHQRQRHRHRQVSAVIVSLMFPATGGGTIISRSWQKGASAGSEITRVPVLTRSMGQGLRLMACFSPSGAVGVSETGAEHHIGPLVRDPGLPRMLRT